MRGFYQRIVNPAIANENWGFVIETCKFKLKLVIQRERSKKNSHSIA